MRITSWLRRNEAVVPLRGRRALDARSVLDERLHLVPARAQETELVVAYPTASDKIFALAWLRDRALLLASKANCLTFQPVSAPFLLPGQRAISIPLPRRTEPHPALQMESAGIHCVQVSPLGFTVATGGACPNDVAVLDARGLNATHLCVGHEDWMCDASPHTR
jgi:hypothetical protein